MNKIEQLTESLLWAKAYKENCEALSKINGKSTRHLDVAIEALELSLAVAKGERFTCSMEQWTELCKVATAHAKTMGMDVSQYEAKMPSVTPKDSDG